MKSLTIASLLLCASALAGGICDAQSDAKTELHVFAAASLSGAFSHLGSSFEKAHPTVSVQFNFGGSQQLVQQLIHGARADIFASADMKQMGIAADAGLIDTAVVDVFARNRLAVILPAKNPAGLAGLKDLAKPGIKVVLADSSVPVGRYALQFLDRCSKEKDFGVSFRKAVVRNVVSYEENVLAVLSKVKLDECDAGIVYTSDIARDSSRALMRIEIPDPLNIVAEYPAAVVNGSAARAIAKSFLEFVASDEGREILSEFGFMPVGHIAKRK